MSLENRVFLSKDRVFGQEFNTYLDYELGTKSEGGSKKRGYYVTVVLIEKVVRENHEYEKSVKHKSQLVLEVKRNSKKQFNEAKELVMQDDKTLIKLMINSLVSSVIESNEGKIVKKKKKEENNFLDSVDINSIAGISEVKEEILDIIDYMKNPLKYQEMGAEMPKGILLYGPPGTGKTLLAKVIASETNAFFCFASGSEFIQKYVGVGPKKIRELFANARKHKPAIIFIDEIDAIGCKRTTDDNAERTSTLNQLLVEMDGFSSEKDVLVIGATNREDLLDDALQRAGRFDRHIYMDYPSKEERLKILNVHSKNKKIRNKEDLERLSEITQWCTGATLKHILNEAAIYAVKDNEESISYDHLDKAFNRCVIGVSNKSRKAREEEIERIAYHEAGHAVISYFLEHKIVSKVSLIPAGKALGYTLNLDSEEVSLQMENDFMNQIKTLLAGMLTEQLFYGNNSSGCSNDLQKITNIIDNMICKYGMSELGEIVIADKYKPFLMNDIKKCHLEILDKAKKETRKSIMEYKEQIELVADFLIKNEEMNEKDFENLMKLKDQEIALG